MRCHPQRQIRRAWRNNTNALHPQKILKGVEPGEDAASDPKKNREESTMCGSKLSENLT
jgi:hypothetical protein